MGIIMAKRKKNKTVLTTTNFNLTNKANILLNKYLTALKQGILNVCKMHTYDSNPSLSQEDFELTYIEQTLGMTCSAVSVSQKAIVDGLAAQKQMEADRNFNVLADNNKTNSKKEDN